MSDRAADFASPLFFFSLLLSPPRVTSLVVTGTMMDICVLSTVVGAFNREYRIAVVEDGVATL